MGSRRTRLLGVQSLGFSYIGKQTGQGQGAMRGVAGVVEPPWVQGLRGLHQVWASGAGCGCHLGTV